MINTNKKEKRRATEVIRTLKKGVKYKNDQQEYEILKYLPSFNGNNKYPE